jgi:hypothetical protein
VVEKRGSVVLGLDLRLGRARAANREYQKSKIRPTDDMIQRLYK